MSSAPEQTSPLMIDAYEMLFSNGKSLVIDAEDRLHAHLRGQYAALRNNTTLIGTSVYGQQTSSRGAGRRER